MKERLIKKFEDELQVLNHELKLELPREIKRARELGDLRENAEYQAAKERQRLVESRISMLQKRVSEIALINVDRIPSDRAGFGSTLPLSCATAGSAASAISASVIHVGAVSRILIALSYGKPPAVSASLT